MSASRLFGKWLREASVRQVRQGREGSRKLLGATGTQFHWGALGDSIEQAQDHPKREHFYFILPSSLSLAKDYSWLRDGRAWVEDIKTLWHFWPVLNKG